MSDIRRSVKRRLKAIREKKRQRIIKLLKEGKLRHFKPGDVRDFSKEKKPPLNVFVSKYKRYVGARQRDILPHYVWKPPEPTPIDLLPEEMRLVPPHIHNPRTHFYFPNIAMRLMRSGVQPVKGAKNKDLLVAAFKTQKNLGKKDIEAFLKEVYNIDVQKVNTLVYEGKLVRGSKPGTFSRRSGYKKAYVQFIESAAAETSTFVVEGER